MLWSFFCTYASPAAIGVTVAQQNIVVSNPPFYIWQQPLASTQETGKNRLKIAM